MGKEDLVSKGRAICALFLFFEVSLQQREFLVL